MSKEENLSKLDKIKQVLGLSIEKEVETEKEVVLADEVVEKEVKEVEAPQMSYATAQELSQFKSEVMEMFKQLLDENKKEMKEVPQELSEVKEKVELSEEPKEIIHSPENEVEKKQEVFAGVNFAKMTPLERIQFKLNN